MDIIRDEEGLRLKATWKEINDAYHSGKTVLCRYWPEWEDSGDYFPARALYIMLGVGMLNPMEYVCYTGEGIFTAKNENEEPVIVYGSGGDGELVPIDLVCSRVDRTLSVDEALNIEARVSNFAGEYNVIWECEPIVGELSDFRYIKDGHELIITPNKIILDKDYSPKVCVRAKLQGMPSICSPIEIVGVREIL